MFYPFKSNEIFHSYQLDQFIAILSVVGWCFYLNKQLKPDQMLYVVASDLGLHCLHLFQKRKIGLYGLIPFKPGVFIMCATLVFNSLRVVAQGIVAMVIASLSCIKILRFLKLFEHKPQG